MKFCLWIVFCIVVFLSGCKPDKKKVSVSTMKFNCNFTTNPIDVNQPYFDTLQFYIRKSNPDLISFKETQFTNKCLTTIEQKGYEFIHIHDPNLDSTLFFSPIAFKSTSFKYLASSFYVYKNDTLEESKNIVSWFQFKNIGSGHIFYVFNIQLQEELNEFQSRLIGIDLLKRIDQISSGLPVILIGDFYNRNQDIKNLLTDNWNNTYPLSDINSSANKSDFLINDFLKVKSSHTNYSNDSLVNNVVFKFNFNTNKIDKNDSGKSLPNDN